MVKKMLFVFLALTICYSLNSCTEDKNQVEELSSPSNLRVEERILYWDEVDKAIGYNVIIDEEIYNTKDAFYDLIDINDSKAYEIEIIALGDNEEYNDSKMTSYTYLCEEIVESGYDEAGFYFTLEEDGRSYALDCGTAYKVTDEGELVLPTYFKGLPVKRIVANAFFKGDKPWQVSEEYINYGITSIVFPEKLITIDNMAFVRFCGIETLRLPAFLEYLGENAFDGCTALKHVYLGRHIKTISITTFNNCKIDYVYMY